VKDEEECEKMGAWGGGEEGARARVVGMMDGEG
jgi:hypothetical protein